MKFEKCTVEDIDEFLKDVRPKDYDEMAKFGEESVSKALYKSISNSSTVWKLTKSDTILCIIGLFSEDGVAFPWIVGTNSLTKNKRFFLRKSRDIINYLSKTHNVLLAWVDPEYRETLLWLRHNGFKKINEGTLGNSTDVLWLMEK